MTTLSALLWRLDLCTLEVRLVELRNLHDAVAMVTALHNPAVSRLRTFAARMLAATEQALFVSRNKGAQRIGSYEDINKDAATQAQGAFRARVLAACLDGESPTPNADGCCVS